MPLRRRSPAPNRAAAVRAKYRPRYRSLRAARRRESDTAYWSRRWVGRRRRDLRFDSLCPERSNAPQTTAGIAWGDLRAKPATGGGRAAPPPDEGGVRDAHG